MEDISNVLMELVPLRDAFPALVHFLRIVLTISVTTAKCERSFSALKRIKRSSMSENRLNDLAIIAIEKNFANDRNLDYNYSK